MSDVLNQIVASESELVRLLGAYSSSFVGYVYGMSFDEALVLTNDDWKHRVNGIPHNSFLVAAGFNPNRLTNAADIDKEVVLLRVLEPVTLPQDNDLVRTRIEHHQRRTAEEQLPGDVNDGLDPMTAAELQSGGLRCSILGTFYMENGQLRLGSDIENFMTLSRMRAYKPTGTALSL
ncbi:MAG: ATPase, partial [Alphaproteobacteria bacterium]